MFSFDDYKKNFEEMFSKSPINLEDFYKSANEYNTKFSKIAFDTFKKMLKYHKLGLKKQLVVWINLLGRNQNQKIT